MDKRIIEEKANKIKLFIMDVDGVLTDGHLIFGNEGEEFKAFHAHDGKGIMLAQHAGIKTAIITGRESKIVDRRAKELDIKEVHQGIDDKLTIYKILLDKFDLEPDETAYIGDDVPDLEVLEKVGLSIVVANGTDVVKDIADYVTEKTGGMGAVREALDLILSFRVDR